MDKPIRSLHHVTATVSGAQEDLDFYTGLLGQRLVKKTVNFDNTRVYHFYYGDERGTPGTIMTTFPYGQLGVRQGTHGVGQITVTSFSVPAGSTLYEQIDWGDGTPPMAVPRGAASVLGHAYQQPGTFVVRYTVQACPQGSAPGSPNCAAGTATDTVTIHFTWIPDERPVREAIRLVEECLAPFAARPHWAKLTEMSPDRVRSLYPRFDDFRSLVREYDPVGRFANPFTDRYLHDGSPA